MNETLVAYVKRLLKHSSIYGVGTLLYRAVALILLPLYTRYLSTGEYGDLSPVWNGVSYFSGRHLS